jgi:hypothetical protein
MLRKLEKVIGEPERHKARTPFAKRQTEEWGEITEETFEDSQKVAIIDSFIFRFSKFQDTLQKKFFPLTLKWLGEDIDNLPFTDWLNRPERLGLIPSAHFLMEQRSLRNLITHTYPWVTEKSGELLEVYENLKVFLTQKGLLKQQNL